MYGRSGSEERQRNNLSFSEEQIEAVATRAAEIALDKIYSEVGKGILKKLAWLMGIVLFSLAVWLIRAGKLVT